MSSNILANTVALCSHLKMSSINMFIKSTDTRSLHWRWMLMLGLYLAILFQTRRQELEDRGLGDGAPRRRYTRTQHKLIITWSMLERGGRWGQQVLANLGRQRLSKRDWADLVTPYPGGGRQSEPNARSAWDDAALRIYLRGSGKGFFHDYAYHGLDQLLFLSFLFFFC